MSTPLSVQGAARDTLADGSASWLSNESNPASAGRAAETAEPSKSDSARPDGLPTPEERVREIVREYPERAYQPVAAEHGRKVREEVLQEPETVEREVATGDRETSVVEDTVARAAVPWVGAVAEFLEWYEEYRDLALRLARGRAGTDEHESFLTDLDNSFTPEYQEKQYARLKALKRQTAGGEYPNGGECGGAFDDPVTVLFGLTASSTTAAGDPRPPVAHDREIRDGWGGEAGTRRTLRYVLQDRLGLDSDEYVWWFQSEPHPGDGEAAGYSHAHPVVVLDAAAVDGGADPTDPETYRPVVAKHVAECPYAELEAHRLGKAVTVREPGEIEDIAGYVSKYIQVDPDTDLLERPPEYLMWAAAQWATTTQKYSKSRGATEAITADKCHQEYADPEAKQPVDHGEAVVRADRYGDTRHECAACGSAWGVSQESLVAARRDGDGAAVATDGGVKRAESGETPPEGGPMGREGELRERWPSARSAGRIGGPTGDPEASGVEQPPVGFEREPEWRPEAVVHRDSDDEESAVGSPGGVEYGEVVREGEGSAFRRIEETVGAGHLPPPAVFEGPEPWRSGPEWLTEEAVRSGAVPPPEVVAREWAEIRPSKPGPARKAWPADWYARRFGTADDAGGDGDDAAAVLTERERAAARRLVESEGATDPVRVAGRLGVDPEKLEGVEAVVASAAG